MTAFQQPARADRVQMGPSERVKMLLKTMLSGLREPI